MVHMATLINLFMVPVVSLYLIYRKKGKPIEKSLELLFQYCIAVACNVPAARVFIVFANKICKIQISVDSGYYTLAALISAVLLAWLYLNVRIEITAEDDGQPTAKCPKDKKM